MVGTAGTAPRTSRTDTTSPTRIRLPRLRTLVYEPYPAGEEDQAVTAPLVDRPVEVHIGWWADRLEPLSGVSPVLVDQPAGRVLRMANVHDGAVVACLGDDRAGIRRAGHRAYRIRGVERFVVESGEAAVRRPEPVVEAGRDRPVVDEPLGLVHAGDLRAVHV